MFPNHGAFVTEHPTSDIRTTIIPNKMKRKMETRTPPPPSPKLQPLITESTGDIFTAPSHSVLLHACNSRGSWGAGVAAAFKSKYPKAYDDYRSHCMEIPNSSRTPASALKGHQVGLLGTCLLIDLCKQQGSSVKGDTDENEGSEDVEDTTIINGTANSHDDRNGSSNALESSHDTQNAARPKPRRQPPESWHYIACLFTSYNYGRNKDKPEEILEATRSAMKDLKGQIAAKRGSEHTVGEIWAVKMNSGLFAVEWEKTKEVLEEAGLPMRVVSPPSQPHGAANQKRAMGNQGKSKRRRIEDGEGSDVEEEPKPRLIPVNILYPGYASKDARRKKKQSGLDGWLA
ncbi:uncharacterized protein KY384_006629 [Bacidia gigantensis]|uniref:uncharacterized protein n=1 Tax=Bacidia gigantensis TaxID=2732470 RepID=UPI001D056D6A|nr:uncharacterized protein KY384_006629 [Bacidia gigantensis]KAG8528940.1 hypothetical protein KY384_006629 [Bacidia gigantensis]